MSDANKNRVPWNKGKSITQEHKNNISKSSTQKGKPSWNKGVSHTEDTKEKMRQSHLGKERPNKGEKYTPEKLARMMATRAATKLRKLESKE